MFSPMADILIPWVCVSIAFCLAFLRVASRQDSRMDEQTAAGSGVEARDGAKPPSPPHHSGTSISIPGPPSDLPSILYMANCHLSSDWQFKQSVAVALPAVILKA